MGGTDLKDVPRTGSGNTKIGHFPEIPTEVLTSEVTYSYPIAAGETYFVLAHAVVDCLRIGRETAWEKDASRLCSLKTKTSLE